VQTPHEIIHLSFGRTMISVLTYLLAYLFVYIAWFQLSRLYSCQSSSVGL